MGNIVYERLTIKDSQWLQQAGQLLTATWPDSWPTEQKGLEEIRGIVNGHSFAIGAINDQNRLVGWVGGLSEYKGNVWELHPLVIAKEYRRQSIGSRLIQLFEKEAINRGAYTVTLGADDETFSTSLSQVDLYDDLWDHMKNIQNLNNHPYEFYQKMGYTLTGVIPDANGWGKPDILLSKRVKSRSQ